ncbi:MAG: AMP-binding protein [Candidatus Riflebacteria bacterium]|nr:AMP-binding protein [Candidatus Riflebacteria bacterium]
MMKLTPALTDDERFPLLSDLSFLKELRQDSCGPRYNFRSGDRLTTECLAKVQHYNEGLKAKAFWRPGEIPSWLPAWLDWCRSTVPAYRNYATSFLQNHSLRREQIARAPWNFVSDECSVDDLLVYNTSGTTGAPMDVLFDPVSQAVWIPQLESILAADDIVIEGGAGRVSICLVCLQESTLTYASLSTYLRGAGVLKINLNPADWNDSHDRISYLEKYNPEILTGDPFTFLALADLAPAIRPKALISSAMTLQTGVRKRLEAQFGCPVYDIYSLTECRMIGVSKRPGVHRLIRPELYVEILHPDHDKAVADGERGEITVTGGINPFLPLIRYRTGDFASLRYTDSMIEICDFEGREPIIFMTVDGRFLNNVDISRAMMEFELAAFTLHQRKDRSVEFTGWGADVSEAEIQRVMQNLFGAAVSCHITIKTDGLPEGKKVQYSSEFNEADVSV